ERPAEREHPGGGLGGRRALHGRGQAHRCPVRLTPALLAALETCASRRGLLPDPTLGVCRRRDSVAIWSGCPACRRPASCRPPARAATAHERSTMTKARFTLHDELGELVIADPPLNLFSLELARDLARATDEARESKARAILVRAEGENFSAGANVEIF